MFHLFPRVKRKMPKKNDLILLSTLMVLNWCAYGQSSIWQTPSSANAAKNSVESSPTSIKAGKILYEANCAACHGNKGKGNGPAAVALSPKPADHTSDAVQKETDGSIFWKLSEGHNSMPSYKSVFTENERWELVNFIRSLAFKSNTK